MLGLALTLVGGAGISCFQAPSDDVTFSCEPGDEPACPAGYSCEKDGCCHRDGSDVEDNLGACALGVDDGTGTTGDESGETGETGATDETGNTDESGATDETGASETGTDTTGTDETG